MIGNKEKGIKEKNFKLFLEDKGLTQDEYFKLVEGSNLIDNLITNDYEKFIEQMSKKYSAILEICGLPQQEINSKNPTNKKFTEFIKDLRLDTLAILETTNYSTEILRKDDIKLIKCKNCEKNEYYYTVDINNSSIGITSCATFNIEEAKDRFEKECYFRNLEKEEEKTLQKMLAYGFGYDTDFSKVLVFEDIVIGRKSEVIKFFKEELEKVDTYLEDPEKQAEERKDFIESAKETIEELEQNNGKQSLEPVVLGVYPMENTFHILNKEEQLEELKYYSEDLEEIELEEKEDMEL